MAKNNIKESQQQGQGVTIGTQGNNDMKIPGPAPHGPNEKSGGKGDRHIPNQERSSAASQEKKS